MTTDSEQRAKELMPRNGRVSEPRDSRLATIRPDSPQGQPQLDYVSPENPLPVRDSLPDDVLWDKFESITISSIVLPFTRGTVEDREIAFVTVESQAVRYRVDGGDPSTTVGIVLEAGDTLELSGQNEIGQFRVIRRDGSDATIRATYGRRAVAP